MSKKMIIATSVLVAVFAITAPVYAQSTSPSLPPSHQPSNGGFFGEIANFFSGFFQHKSHSASGGQEQNQQQGPNQPAPSVSGTGENAPSGMIQQPSGTPEFSSMQQRRLSYLVQQGKITQAQADAILAELQKVQTELKTWADSEGINEQYVLGGPMGGMGQGQSGQQGGFQNDSNQQGGGQQFRPMMQQSGQQGSQGGSQGYQGGQEPNRMGQ